MKLELGRLEDLPPEYLSTLEAQNLTPLWPSLRVAIPHHAPARKAQPCVWNYQQIRPLLLRAGDLAPIDKAERRVLVLCNPGYDLQELKATPSIYVGLQLILPGETAPNHRHTPSAVRFVIEGHGGYTVVDGEKLPMEKGDLILTPAGVWHEHGHDGTEPVVWMDALDLPVLVHLEASYSIEAPSQPVVDPTNSSYISYGQGGIVPYASMNRRRDAFPLMRFPWNRVRETLDGIARVSGPSRPAHVAYINPETGQECLPTLGFSALRLQAAEPVDLPLQSASMVLHVVEGHGEAHIDGIPLEFDEHDTLAVPTRAKVSLEATGRNPAYLFIVDDAPLQRRLGIYNVLDQNYRT